jgi:hypothetical protein
MYDVNVFQEAMLVQGLNAYRLGRKADVDPKTAKQVVNLGTGHPDSIYAVAKALGLDVKKRTDGKGNVSYDFSAIMKSVERKRA